VKYFARFIPVITAFIFFILNIFTPLIADDFSYSFIFGTERRISSIHDIIISQYNHYTAWGGRIVAHFLAQFFLFIGKNYFNIFNVIIFTVFNYLLYFHITGSIKQIKPFLWTSINIFLWFLVPVWGQNFLWLTGSCNYLWTTTIILFFLIPFRKKHDNHLYNLNIFLSIPFTFLGVFAGWTNENSGAAVLFLLIAFFIIKIKKREKPVLFEILGSVGFLAGFSTLIAAPGNYKRIDYFSPDTSNFLVILFKRLYAVTVEFYKYGYILAGVSILLAVELLYHQKKKINAAWGGYILAGFAGAYSMILSPPFPERAFFIVIVFLTIALLSLVNQAGTGKVIKRNILIFTVIVFIFFSFSFLLAGKNIMGIYLKSLERSRYILTQKEKNITDVEVKAPIPAVDKHAALYGLSDIGENPDFWLNVAAASYYNLKSIRGIEDDKSW
jgi:hypothetical protein